MEIAMLSCDFIIDFASWVMRANYVLSSHLYKTLIGYDLPPNYVPHVKLVLWA